MKKCDIFRGSKHTLTLHIFRGSGPRQPPGIYAPESSYKWLSQLALDLVVVASHVSQAYVERLFSLCNDLTARKRNSTKVSLCRWVFSETEPSHSALNAMYWELKCNLFLSLLNSRRYFTETEFLTFTDLSSRTTLTYKNVKSKTKMLPKRKRKCQCKTKANLILKTKKILQQ